MDGTPSDDRALDVSADIGLTGPRHMLFIHGRIPSLEKSIFESMLSPSIFQVATKGLAMDAHRVTLTDGSPAGSSYRVRSLGG